MGKRGKVEALVRDRPEMAVQFSQGTRLEKLAEQERVTVKTVRFVLRKLMVPGDFEQIAALHLRESGRKSMLDVFGRSPWSGDAQERLRALLADPKFQRSSDLPMAGHPDLLAITEVLNSEFPIKRTSAAVNRMARRLRKQTERVNTGWDRI